MELVFRIILFIEGIIEKISIGVIGGLVAGLLMSICGVSDDICMGGIVIFGTIFSILMLVTDIYDPNAFEEVYP